MRMDETPQSPAKQGSKLSKVGRSRGNSGVAARLAGAGSSFRATPAKKSGAGHAVQPGFYVSCVEGGTGKRLYMVPPRRDMEEEDGDLPASGPSTPSMFSSPGTHRSTHKSHLPVANGPSNGQVPHTGDGVSGMGMTGDREPPHSPIGAGESLKVALRSGESPYASPRRSRKPPPPEPSPRTATPQTTQDRRNGHGGHSPRLMNDVATPGGGAENRLDQSLSSTSSSCSDASVILRSVRPKTLSTVAASTVTAPPQDSEVTASPPSVTTTSPATDTSPTAAKYFPAYSHGGAIPKYGTGIPRPDRPDSPGSVSVTSISSMVSVAASESAQTPSYVDHGNKQTLGDILHQIEVRSKSLLQRDDYMTADVYPDLQYLAHQARYSSDHHIKRRLISKLVECGLLDIFVAVFHSVHSVDYFEVDTDSGASILDSSRESNDLSADAPSVDKLPQQQDQNDLDGAKVSESKTTESGVSEHKPPSDRKHENSESHEQLLGATSIALSDPMKNIRSVITFMWNATDKSSTLCEQCIKRGVIQMLVEELKAPQLAAIELKDPNRLYLVKGYLGILNNVVRFYNDTREIFREAGAVKVLQQFLKSSLLLVKTKTIILLSYLINESENDVINASDRNIGHVVKMLNSALECDNHYSKKYGYWAVEVAAGLNRLGVFEYNKERIVTRGAVPLYVRLLQASCSDDEQLVAAQGVWTFCFHSLVCAIMAEDSLLCTALQKLVDSGQREDVKRAARGALWVIEGRKGIMPPKSPKLVSGSSNHVMLSYQWASKPIVQRLKERLRASGYRVHLDTDNQSTCGSSLEAVTEAVDKAVVVLLCMTQRYKDHPSCRNEVEYALLSQKDLIPVRIQPQYTPDGWLGSVVANKLAFDISTPENLDHVLANLVRELGSRGRSRAPAAPPSEPGDLGSKASTSRASSQSSLVTTVAQVHTSAPPTPQHGPASRAAHWTPDDVLRWLHDSGLGPVATDRLNGLSGDLLVEVRRMQQAAPEAFYSTLRHELGMDFISVLRFTKALERL